jgi:hypothetical protein
MTELRNRVKQAFPKSNQKQKTLVQDILTHYEGFIFLSVEEAVRSLGNS